jgi:hypothetical protein
MFLEKNYKEKQGHNLSVATAAAATAAQALLLKPPHAVAAAPIDVFKTSAARISSRHAVL